MSETTRRDPALRRDLDDAATHGGPGWRARTASHAQEVAEGRLWAGYRVRSEVAPLRAVLLAEPGGWLAFDDDPDAWLMLARPDVEALRRQAADVARFYAARGVAVHWVRPRTAPPPNLLFVRDLLLMTPQGAVLGRPAARQREGEERFVAEALALAGVPILRTMTGTATFEGADALWLDENTLLVGVGLRTNAEAVAILEQLLQPMGVRVLPVPLDAGGVQHLLGVVNFVDRDLAALRVERASGELRRVLADRGVTAIELPDDDEMVRGRGHNLVCLEPRHVVMPAGCPGIAARLAGVGVTVHELDVSEYVKAAGALGCLTGILARG